MLETGIGGIRNRDVRPVAGVVLPGVVQPAGGVVVAAEKHSLASDGVIGQPVTVAAGR